MSDLCADCLRWGADGCVTVGGKCGPSVQEEINANWDRRSELHEEVRKLEEEAAKLLRLTMRAGR